MSGPSSARSLATDIETVAKFIKLIESKSFNADDIWIQQRRVKTISDSWDYRYAVLSSFDPFPSVHTVLSSSGPEEISQAWEQPRITAVQLLDYLEELQDKK